jgi:xylulokinase
MSESKAMPPFTLGIDLGTSSVKVVAVGIDGELVGEGAASFETESRLPLQAEQHSSDWLKALSNAALALEHSVTRAHGTDATWSPAAIGLTGQLPTLVCLSDGIPVGRAITWKDGRADEWASKRLDPAHRARFYARTGMPIDGRYLAPMLQYHWGVRSEQLTSVLSAKDYLLYALTGNLFTEPSTAAGYGVYDLDEGCFSDDLMRFWNLPRRLLPRIEPANALAGPLSATGAKILNVAPGIPVSTGFRLCRVRHGGTGRARGFHQLRLERRHHRRQCRAQAGRIRAVPADTACDFRLVRPRNGSVGVRHRVSMVERHVGLGGRSDRS